MTSGSRVNPTSLPVLSRIDIAAGWVSGYVGVDEWHGPTVHPVDALRACIRTALCRPPCIVSFSGGRDSSIILALAADTARREGLEPPVAMTHVYPDDLDAQESEYQEAVLRHLADAGVGVEHERMTIRDEFDLVGPLVAPVLKSHGAPVWPASLGPTVALATRAAGGSVLTGEFGDEITGPQRMTLLSGVVRRRGRGLTSRDWRAVGTAALPRAVAARLDRSVLEGRPWLTAEGRTELLRRHRADALHQPMFWDRSVRYWTGRRAADLGRETMNVVAGWHDCLMIHPLGEPSFVASFAEFGGLIGLPSRSAATSLLSAGLLPDSVVRRRGKSTFNASRFGAATREFVGRWSGTGTDPALVDAEVLARRWRDGRFEAPSAMLVQQAWLADGRT